MIVLDAGVLIGLLDATDAHHEEALTLLTAHADEELTIGPINLAEVLVRAAQHGREEAMSADLHALGVRVTPLPEDAALRLARLRATTGIKMPDCCVLLTVEQTGGTLATFDERVKTVAASRGIHLA